jgi:hypothetical protein
MTQMNLRRVMELAEPVEARTPSDWRGQLRRGMPRAGQSVRLPAGAWLLELGLVELPAWAGRGSVEYRYRLADGSVAAFDAPLPEACAREIGHPQAVASMNAFRSLDEAMQDDYGLEVSFISGVLQPFALIRCPLCGGTRFGTLEFGQVYCVDCNATFSVRHTAGDPGFVVDCTWSGGLNPQAKYILPRAERMCLTLVLKDDGGGDPRELCHDPRKWCRDDCRPEAVCLTDGTTGLRAGLHACRVGTLYDWDLYGTPPAPRDMEQGSTYEIAGARWPDCAAVKLLDGLMPRMLALELPKLEDLGEGEHYLLHSFRSYVERGYAYVLPIWTVVRLAYSGHHLDRVEVVRADICPVCGKPVTAADIGARGKSWEIPHGRCREKWELSGWTLPATANAA